MTQYVVFEYIITNHDIVDHIYLYIKLNDNTIPYYIVPLLFSFSNISYLHIHTYKYIYIYIYMIIKLLMVHTKYVNCYYFKVHIKYI